MPTYAVTIAGVSRQIVEGWTLREMVNGRNALSGQVFSASAGYRPAVNDELIITEDGTRIFGGLIDEPTGRDYAGHGSAAIETICSAVDFSAYADRRVVIDEIGPGTLKAFLEYLEGYLTPYGVALDVGQVTGPTIQVITSDYGRVDEILNQLSILSDGYVWEIDYTKTLRMFLPGSTAAPFSLVDGDGHAIGEITVEPSRNDYANKIYVRGGTGQHTVEWERHNGDGSVREFLLKVPLCSLVGAEVRVSFAGEAPVGTFPVGVFGVDTAFIWTYEAATNELHQSTAQTVIGVGGYVEATYLGQFPYTASADNGGPASALVERVLLYPDIFDTDLINAMAEALLPQFLAQPRTVTFTTRYSGLKPGQVMTVTIPSHSISAVQFLIVEIETRAVDPSAVERTVTMVEGTLNLPTWRDVYRTWSGQGVPSIASGSVIGGTGGGAITTGQAFFLGGSRNTSVGPTPAAYTPVTGYVPHVALTGFTGRVRVELWARDPAVGVTARLRNVTDSTTTGTSSVVTSQTPTMVTFDVAITAGKTYRLEVLSSVNGAGVFGIGVLESV